MAFERDGTDPMRRRKKIIVGRCDLQDKTLNNTQLPRWKTCHCPYTRYSADNLKWTRTKHTKEEGGRGAGMSEHNVV